MVCPNCGKELNIGANFCPMCGTNVSAINKTDSVEVQKNKKKKWYLFIIAGIVIILLILALWSLTKARNTSANISVSTTEPSNTNTKALQTEVDDHEDIINDPVPSEIDTQTEKTVTVESEETNALEAAEKTSEAESGSWLGTDKTHEYDTETVLYHDDVAYSNFNDMVAVGINTESSVTSSIETEIGFILSVIDNDSVKVTFYNYGSEYVVPVKVTAEKIDTDFVDESGAKEYVIDGYGDYPNGVGIITMELSNGKSVQAVVFRNAGVTCVANIGSKSDTMRYHEYRILSQETRERFHVTPENSTFTSPIYYPIVPLNDKEKLDVEPWIKLSNELVESDWTQARKVATYYRWLIENVAYDYWLVNDTDVKLRAKYHHDYTGTWHISKTRVGICHDYSQVLAIMCRTQGIPAVVLSDYGQLPHAWNDIYLSDYNRWISIDCTPDAKYGCYSEDYAQWRADSSSHPAYRHFDDANSRTNIDGVSIGNMADIEKQGVDIPYHE